MTEDKTRDGLRGLTTRLIALCVAMVVAGFVLPSPGTSATRPAPAAAKATASLYQAMKQPAPPADLIVPSLGIRSRIVPIQVVDHVLTPPADARIVGWWDGSAMPGKRVGQTVLTGHTVHSGGGVMDRLGQIRRGAIVRVRTPKGMMDYAATRVVVYTKEQLAENANDLFRQDRKDPRLVLITCTGWTGSYYTSNVIVFGKPLGVRKQQPRPVPPGTSAAARS